MPSNPPLVTMYVCGPTVYDYPHIGNWRCFVVFDVVRRYLEHVGYEVVYVQNFTDVDDKIIARAQKTGASWSEIARKFEEVYLEQAALLNIKRADFHPRATEHIPEMIALVQALLDRGHAYVVEGDVYFDAGSFAGYGKLSGQKLEELLGGARVEVDPRKRSPLDFALWKSSKPGEPWWDSPWGPGRPGWHVECSAMSLHYLGQPIDIHAGGTDLIFPHHENEIAQSEGATGREFVRYWLHNGFLNIGGERMGKSLGNFYTLEDLKAKVEGEAVRLFLLSAHYRSPLNFGEEELRSSQAALHRLRNVVEMLLEKEQSASSQRPAGAPAGVDAEGQVEGVRGAGGVEQRLLESVRSARVKFRNAMDDDMNTAGALAAVFDLSREVNLCLSEDAGVGRVSREAWRQAVRVYRDLAWGVLGVLRDLLGQQESGVGARPRAEGMPDVDALVGLLLEVREGARARKDWRTADEIRARLAGLGVVVEDTPEGPRWKKRWGMKPEGTHAG